MTAEQLQQTMNEGKEILLIPVDLDTGTIALDCFSIPLIDL